MSDESPRLLALARRLSEGEPVDWPAAERDAPAGEAGVVKSLRELQAVVEAHRTCHPAGEPPGDEETPTLELGGPAAPIGRWGPLALIAPLGTGSRGEVFRARDTRLDREVALKLLRPPSHGPDGAGTPAAAEPAAVSALLAEGRLLARVRHPNIVTIHGAEIHDGRVGIWMELVRGRTLTALLREQGVFGAREAGLIGLDLCVALAAVHHAGLLHRDVKADNVMREAGGRIVLMDFSVGADRMQTGGPLDRPMSGTPLYMAPERLEGSAATPASDLYALGVLLFLLVTGEFPVRAASLEELRAHHVSGARRPLGGLRPDLPPAFVRVVEQALSPDPRDRFPSAAAMEQALAAALGVAAARPEPTLGIDPAAGRRRARPAILALAAAGVVAAIALGLYAVRTRGGGAATTTRHEAAPPVADPSSEPTAPIAPPVADAGAADDGGAAASVATYQVEAAFFRGTGVRERLAAGDRVRVGDALSLDFRASRDLYLYVINEDDLGQAVLMYPLAARAAAPLRAGITHRIPVEDSEAPQYWQVTSAGVREHFLILASPERLADLERSTRDLARPGSPAADPVLTEAARTHLRGVAGLMHPAAAVSPRAPLFESAERLGRGPDTATGPWMRRMDLENPR